MPAKVRDRSAYQKAYRESHKQELGAKSRKYRIEHATEIAAKSKAKYDPVVWRTKRLLKIGLSEEKRDRALSGEGWCDICGLFCTRKEVKNALGKTMVVGGLVVDHCHVSGKVRGLLCSECNLGLGKFKDSLNKLRKAVSYLENFGVTDSA